MKAQDYGGFMIWALDLDEFRGYQYPLLSAMNDQLGEDAGTNPPITTM